MFAATPPQIEKSLILIFSLSKSSSAFKIFFLKFCRPAGQAAGHVRGLPADPEGAVPERDQELQPHRRAGGHHGCAGGQGGRGRQGHRGGYATFFYLLPLHFFKTSSFNILKIVEHFSSGEEVSEEDLIFVEDFTVCAAKHVVADEWELVC